MLIPAGYRIYMTIELYRVRSTSAAVWCYMVSVVR
jgi:hypothetical protein